MAVSSQTNLFTTAVTWGGKENLEAFLKSLSQGTSPLATPGIRIIDNVQSSYKLNLFDAIQKKTKAYATGLSGGTGATYTQRTLTVTDMKAEAANSAQEFKNTVFETARKKGYAANDITDTVLQDIIMEIWMRGVRTDLFRQFWLSHTHKETVTSGQYTGTADTDYNAYQGMWDLLITNSATTTPSSSGTHIYKKAMDTGAVAQKATITITALPSPLAGTFDVIVNGVTYSQALSGTAAAIATAFYTTHAAALALRDVTLTNPGSAAVAFTSAIPGVPITVTLASSNDATVGAGVVATTATTAPSALADDESIAYLEDLYINSYPELVTLPMEQKVFLADYNMYHNYMEALEDGGINTDYGKQLLSTDRGHSHTEASLLSRWIGTLTLQLTSGQANTPQAG